MKRAFQKDFWGKSDYSWCRPEFYRPSMGEGKRDAHSKFPSLHGPLATGFSFISTVPGNRQELWKQQRSMGRTSALFRSAIPGKPHSQFQNHSPRVAFPHPTYNKRLSGLCAITPAQPLPLPLCRAFPTQKQPLQEQRLPNTSTAQRKPASHVSELHKIFPSLGPSPLTLHVIPSDPVKRTDSCYYTATAALRKLGSREVSLPVPNHPSEGKSLNLERNDLMPQVRMLNPSVASRTCVSPPETAYRASYTDAPIFAERHLHCYASESLGV